MGICCSELMFEHKADASHADGCEFTLGTCRSCGAWLVHCFHTAVVHEGVYETIDADMSAKIQTLGGRELKEFMRAWYRAIQNA
jgi:hypothetical protein